MHLHHRIPHMLTPSELKLLHPRRRLAPFLPPSPLNIMMDEQEGEEEGEGGGEDECLKWQGPRSSRVSVGGAQQRQ